MRPKLPHSRRPERPRHLPRRLARLFSRRRIAATALLALVLVPGALVLARQLRPPADPLPAARLLLAGGDGAAAEPYVRRALELKPSRAVAWQLLGECLRLRGSADDADDAFRRARALAPAWDAPAVALAVRALADGRRAHARRLVDETLHRGANTSAVLRLRARLRAHDADFAGAAQDLATAATRRGGRARDLLEAVEHERASAFVAGRLEPSVSARLDDAERRAAKEPDPAAVLAALRLARGVPGATPDTGDETAVRHVLALDRAGRLDDALRAALALRTAESPDALGHAAVSLTPQDSVRLMALVAAAPGVVDGMDAHGTLAEHEACAHLAAARGRAAAGHAAVALAHLRELALSEPDDPDVAFAVGTRLGLRGDPAAALDLAERMPGGAGSAAGRRLLGWFHVGAGEARRAQSFLLPEGLAGDGLDAVRDALAAARADGPDKTAARARATLRSTPDDAHAMLLLGLVAMHRGDDANACAQLTAALARAPSLAVAANDLAWCLAKRGDRADLAAPLAEWAIHLAPDDPHFHDTYSEVQRAMRRPSHPSERTPR